MCRKLIPRRQGREGTETTSKSKDYLQHFSYVCSIFPNTAQTLEEGEIHSLSVLKYCYVAKSVTRQNMF